MAEGETELFLDREGRFFFGGAPCIRAEITGLFFEKLEEDGRGGYRIRLGQDERPVRVEEAPLRVFHLIGGSAPGPPAIEKDGKHVLVLDAEMIAELDPKTLRYEGDVPWCRARGLGARFTPTAALSLGREIAEGRIVLPS